ncbi:MAG TPA: type II secretion system protein GspE, partial [Burkholderiales bacterium]|nr:type II secretion system protein GspE [Burkholderiales bacterium]
IDETLRKYIHDGRSEQEIRTHAVSGGMMNLRQDGMRWVEKGETSLEELLRVTKD